MKNIELENELRNIFLIDQFERFRIKFKQFFIDLNDKKFIHKKGFDVYYQLLEENAVTYNKQIMRLLLQQGAFKKEDSLRFLYYIVKANDELTFNEIITQGILSQKHFDLTISYILNQKIIDKRSIIKSIHSINEISLVEFWSSYLKNHLISESAKNRKAFLKEELVNFLFNYKSTYLVPQNAWSSFLNYYCQRNGVLEFRGEFNFENKNNQKFLQDLGIFIENYIDLPKEVKTSKRLKKINEFYTKLINKKLFLLECAQ